MFWFRSLYISGSLFSRDLTRGVVLVKHGEICSNSSVKLIHGCGLVFGRFVEGGEDSSYSVDF